MLAALAKQKMSRAILTAVILPAFLLGIVEGEA
jgi:hypothetical protein